MPRKESGKRRGIEEIEKGYDRARSIQKPFNVNELEWKLITDHMEVTGFVNFREYVMHQIRFCVRYDKGEEVLKERIDEIIKGGGEIREDGTIDPAFHPEIIKQVIENTVRATSQFHIMRALLQSPVKTYEDLKRGVEAFLSLDSLEFDEMTFQNQLIVLISQNIVFCDEVSQPPVYSLVVVRDLLEKLEETLYPELLD